MKLQYFSKYGVFLYFFRGKNNVYKRGEPVDNKKQSHNEKIL